MTISRLLGGMRSAAGTLAFDRPRLSWPVVASSLARRRWVDFRNRRERLVPGPSGNGYDCDWQWTSDLTVAEVFPAVGRRLLRAALEGWPLGLAEGGANPAGSSPAVSFVIGHSGEARMPLLLTTVKSLLAQGGCESEIVVVEQSIKPLLAGRLPSGVRLIHQLPPNPGMPYSRSWAFNRGALEARGRILVFHDNDVLAPAGYAAELLRLVDEGFEAIRLQRFVFYLDAASTERAVAQGEDGVFRVDGLQPEHVRQNCQGHTIAVTRDAYVRIGGHDEAFLGWGGEDNEFYDRCRLLRFHPWGYLPFLHLWHAPQPGKVRPGGVLTRLDEAMAVSREERARRLASVPFGSPIGPLLGRTA